MNMALRPDGLSAEAALGVGHRPVQQISGKQIGAVLGKPHVHSNAVHVLRPLAPRLQKRSSDGVQPPQLRLRPIGPFPIMKPHRLCHC